MSPGRTRSVRSDRRATALTAVMILAGVIVVFAFGGKASHATSPARNGPIVFSGDKGSGADIYTINDDGGGLRRLTHVDGDAGSPDWSPDGTRIVFGIEDRAVYLMNADGSDLHQVTAPGGEPTFTPDGAHLVYWCDSCGGGDGLFLIRDDGSDAPGQRLTTNPFREGDEDPEFSPDGQTITFVRHKVGGKLQALFALDVGGGEPQKLIGYRREVAITHDWAPDGRQIVVTTNADYPNHKSPNVATIRPDGSHLRMLTHYSGGEQGAFAGSYSPNGRWIVFRIENVEKERFGLYRMHPDGTHRQLIKALPFPPRQSDWGPK